MSFGLSAAAVGFLGIGAGVAGSAISSRSAKKARQSQEQGAAQSDATQRYQYDTTRADNAPFRETGLQANYKLADLMHGGQFGRRFQQSDMDADPVYQSGLQFGLDQGVQGINRQAAAGGSMLSGATLKALTRFGSDYGSTKANESYNRFNADQNSQYNKLAGLSGAGQQATNQISAAGTNMANNISQSQQGLGNARGSSYLAQGNAWQNALNGGISALRGGNSLGGMSGFGGISDGGYSVGQGAAYGGSTNGGIFTPNRAGM